MILNRLFKRRTEAQPELEEGLKKTRRGIFADITALFDRSDIDEELFEDLEALLIQADLGVDTTLKLVEALREDIRRERITNPAVARTYPRDEMVKLLENATKNRKVKIFQRGVPFVILVVGVNGTGKTTTIAKLANFHKARGRNVMLVAADTFRAAAIDQLKVWGERVNVPVIAHGPGA
ncbi:MAG TPA: signal recognition particle receptor subunit alpha, partial [Thermomicrobiales bacterium]|nr:signal recognition particle receptor subunit alpha [Thermomicrobiales bacterium]